MAAAASVRKNSTIDSKTYPKKPHKTIRARNAAKAEPCGAYQLNAENGDKECEICK